MRHADPPCREFHVDVAAYGLRACDKRCNTYQPSDDGALSMTTSHAAESGIALAVVAGYVFLTQS